MLEALSPKAANGTDDSQAAPSVSHTVGHTFIRCPTFIRGPWDGVPDCFFSSFFFEALTPKAANGTDDPQAAPIQDLVDLEVFEDFLAQGSMAAKGSLSQRETILWKP